jgi:3-hydroxyisobutyrate dehydrogenase
VPLDVGAAVDQVYRRARARYGDNGGEMMPIKLLEDLTATQLRLAPPPP